MRRTGLNCGHTGTRWRLVSEMPETRYFLTVSWCHNEWRGPFVNRQGTGYSSETPHTQDEMQGILGPFWLILNPQSEPFTAEELARYIVFHSLAEYQHAFGIAADPDRLPPNGVIDD